MVESYLEGDEFAVCYALVDGKAYQAGFTRTFTYMVRGFTRIVSNLHSMQSIREIIYPAYMASANDKVIKLIQNMECREGIVFIQMKYRDGEFYFLEAAIRLPGIGAWRKEKEMFGINGIEYLVHLALHRDMSQVEKNLQNWSQSPLYSAAEYFPAVKAGTIARIVGLDQVKAMEGVTVVLERFHEGETIGYNNSMYQIAYYILISAEDDQELMDQYDQINETLHIYDQQGEEMLIKFDPRTEN